MTALPSTVVLFGASGFIGRNVARKLSGQLERLIAVTHKTRHLDGVTDVVTIDEIDALGPIAPDTIIIHAAAHRYDARTFQNDQIEILDRNVELNNRIYRFAAQRGVKEVRSASSVAVYPASFDLLDDERDFRLDDWPHDGEAFYAWSKRWGEVLAQLYRRRFGINTLSFRLSNPYGPFDTTDPDAAHVATAFVIRALQSGDSFKILGNANARRDFIFAEDVGEVLLQSLSVRGKTTAVNLAYGEAVSILDLAKAALAATGRADKTIITSPEMTGGVAVRAATNKMLHQLLPGLAPFHTLEAGLAKTAEWYRHELKL